MNARTLVLLFAATLLSGCAAMLPKSWDEPIAPTVSTTSDVEKPWEAIAIRHVDGKIFSVAIPEKWYGTQFPYVPVKEPESKEVIPLQRMTSRVALLCDGTWIRSSAVINRTSYDVLVPPPCKDGDKGFIVSGSGKVLLTFGSEIVHDVAVERLFVDAKYREGFFTAHPSTVRGLRTGTFPTEVTKQLSKVIATDGGRYRVGFETLLAVMITVGSSIEERFLDCGGGNINIVAAVLRPETIAVNAGISLICAAVGQPKGLFLPDSEFVANEERSEKP